MNTVVKLFFALGSVGLMMSCHSGNDEDCCPVMDTELELWVKDKDGRNLLSPEIPGHYEAADIRLYYLQNGVAQEVYDPSQNAPRNFFIYQNQGNGQKLLRVFPDEGTPPWGTWTTTLIRWDAHDVDTIQTRLIKSNSSSVTCWQVTYNRKTVYDRATAKPIVWGGEHFDRLIEVVKP